MKKHSAMHKALVQSALASTLFISVANSFADETISASEVGPFSTSLSGDITVTQTGQLFTNGATTLTFDGINNSTVTLLEGNNYFNVGTIQPTNAIAVVMAEPNATLKLEPVTSIRTARTTALLNSDGIQITNVNTTIDNAGLIFRDPGGSVIKNLIHVQSTGDNANIVVSNTGKIQALGDPLTLNAQLLLVDSGATGFTLDNAGSILLSGSFTASNSSQTESAIVINGQFNMISNSGFIEKNSSNSLATSNFGQVVLLNPDSQSGDFVNDTTGHIVLYQPQDYAVFSNTIAISGPMNDFINYGFIENAIPRGSLPPASTNNGFVINLEDGAALNSLQNFGRMYNNITNANRAVINATSANATIFNGLSNSGDIVNGRIGKSAINFTGMQNASIFNSGNIVGNVLLADSGNSNGAPVFKMTDGTVAGRVTGSSSQGTIEVSGGTLVSIEDVLVQTFNVSGGHITNTLLLPVSTPTLNFSGGHIGFINTSTSADNTFNFTGGTFFVLDGSQAGVDGGNGTGLLNILSSYETDGQIYDMTKVHIQNPGTVFRHNNILNGMVENGFIIDAQTTYIPSNVVTPLSGEPPLEVDNYGTISIVNDRAVFDFTDSSLGTDIFKSVITNHNGSMVRIAPSGVLRILGNNTGPDDSGNPLFVSESGSIFNVQINGQCCDDILYGKMIVDSFSNDDFAVQFETGSFIQPQFKGFLPRDSELDMVTVHTGGNANAVTIENKATLIPYPSALVYFTMDTLAEGTGISPAPEYNSVVRLTSHRNTFQIMSSTQVTVEVANTLDEFADSGCPPTNDFCRLLSAFDQIPTPQGVEEGMQSLLPPFNYALIAASHIGMDSVFDAVTDRVFELAWDCMHNQVRFPARIGLDRPVQKVGSVKNPLKKVKKTQQTKQTKSTVTQPQQEDKEIIYQGMSAGENSTSLIPLSFWFRPIGVELNQDERKGIAGYRAKAGGVAVGLESGFNDCTMYGVAFSYTHTNVHDKAFAPKDEAIKSWQGTVYGAYDFCYGIFTDAMFGYARNQYKLNRVIHVHDLKTAAQSGFYSSQWGAQGDIGISVPNTWNVFLAPFARLQYIRISFDDYVETGASDLSLTVDNHNAIEFYGGIGFKLSKQFCVGLTEWIPELTMMLARDFRNDAETTFAGFAGGGTPFNTIGITPGSGIWNTALALHGVCGPSVMSLKYTLDIRNQFVGSSAYIQFYYNW